MKNVFKLLLLVVVYLALFILGATSGIIHPACYAYIGALLPVAFALVYLNTCAIIRGFGAACFLNGILLMAGLLTGEADMTFVICIAVITVLAEIVRKIKGYNTLKGIRWSFVPFAFSFFAYTAHWWTDTEGSLAAAREEMPVGYDELMKPVIDNITMLIVVLALTIPVAMLAIRLAERAMKKTVDGFLMIAMKPNYKNWIPKGMIIGTLGGAAASLVLFLVFGVSGLLAVGTWKTILKIVFLVLAIALALITLWMWLLYRAFSYDGKRQMSRQIIDGVASHVTLPEGGRCLDVGCGSGALTIAVAKHNPKAEIVGIDRWGAEYASYNKQLCEENARAEGVDNRTSFSKGNALKLDFDDETFDAVCSNYVYHNIPSRNRQSILLETLRVLKKGGTFAIHDIFSTYKYGDMQAFVQQLKKMGYEEVELIDTTKGVFMSPREALWMGLSGSAILKGRK